MTNAIDRAARAMQIANRVSSGYLNEDQREAAESAALPAYRDLARAGLIAALENPQNPDWLPRLLAEAAGEGFVFEPEPVCFVAAMRRAYWNRVADAVRDEILGTNSE